MFTLFITGAVRPVAPCCYRSYRNERSIRDYTKDAVSDDAIKALLKAAMCAPSAANAQPWHFIVIRNRKILDEIPQVVSTGQMVRDAPLAIAICADTKLEKYHGFWVQDCSAAAQNLLLAATTQGLGAVWAGAGARLLKTERGA